MHPFSPLEFLKLLWINLKVSFFNLIEWIRVAVRYYPNLSFAKADLSLLLMYLFNSPYRISKNFLKVHHAEDPYQYGETPLTTLDLISQECGIGKNDHLFELGCGRARTCFWLRSFRGCQVTGIDYIPFFIERAQRVQRKLKIPGLTFLAGNFFTADLSQATFIYLYGTNLEDAAIQTLIDTFESLPQGTKIITTSFALEDYAPNTFYKVIKCFTAPFVWGQAEIYLQVKTR